MQMLTPLNLQAATAAMLNEVVPHMQTGDAVIYHTGSLMRDRKVGPDFQRVHGAGTAAYDAYTRGEVTLVQRKLRPLVFEYIAIKRAPKVESPTPRQRANARRFGRA